jgi:hypothetical protein
MYMCPYYYCYHHHNFRSMFHKWVRTCNIWLLELGLSHFPANDIISFFYDWVIFHSRYTCVCVCIYIYIYIYIYICFIGGLYSVYMCHAICMYYIFFNHWFLGTSAVSIIYCEQSCNKHGYASVFLIYWFTYTTWDICPRMVWWW